MCIPAVRQSVMVPRFYPRRCVVVDEIEEEGVNEPYVGVVVGVQAMVNLQALKEFLPLAPETLCDVNP